MTHKKSICPVCEEGSLTKVAFAGDFKHNGRTIHVEDLECYHCDSCGADPVFEDQIRRNHLKVADAKRREDGLLTGAEIRATREKLKLTQSEAAELFGGGANAFSKYERGDVLQSQAMDRLIRLVVRHPVLLDELRGISGHGERGWVSAETTESALSSRLVIDRAGMRNATVIELATWKRDAA